jgi:chromosome segregation ATPase
VRALQSQGEEVQAELEKTQEKRREAEDGLAAAKRKITRLEEDVKYAQENAKEAVMLSADRERQVLEGMRGELGEEGMLEAALERAREECDDLRKRVKEAEEAADRAPSSRLEMECSAMKSQIAALEKDLVESKGLVNRLRREERERIEEMQRQVEAGGGGGGSGGGVARELDSMLQLRLEVSELRGKLQDSEDEVTRLGEELDGLRREADEAVVSGQKIRSEAAVRVEESVNAERAETQRVKGELELVLKQLVDARSKLTEMEGWKGKAERAQEALEAERVKRLEDVKEAEEEAALRQKEWREAMSEVEARSHEWRRNAEEGDWGRVKQLEAEAEELRLAAIEEMENLQARIDELEEDAKERAKEAEERESDLKLQMTMVSKDAAKAAGASRASLETAQGKLKERDGTIRGLQTQIATYEQAQQESFEEVQQLRQQVMRLACPCECTNACKCTHVCTLSLSLSLSLSHTHTHTHTQHTRKDAFEPL